MSKASTQLIAPKQEILPPEEVPTRLKSGIGITFVYIGLVQPIAEPDKRFYQRGLIVDIEA